MTRYRQSELVIGIGKMLSVIISSNTTTVTKRTLNDDFMAITGVGGLIDSTARKASDRQLQCDYRLL